MITSLLRLITLPYLQQNRLRAAFTTLGVALGVSVFVAIRVTNLSTLHAFEETLDAVSGRTQLQVVGDIDGIDASLYPRVRSMPGVAAAVPVVMGYGAAEDWDGTMLLMLGVDVFLDRNVREYRIVRRDEGSGDPLRLLLDPATLFVSETFAHRHQLGVGAALTLLTPQGRQSYTIQGLLSPHGPATALGGNFAVMDISAAQQAFAKPGRLD
ncbi:MAG: ABC transporter permease, partial [Candidatus Entotheonellia bacterium]